MHHTPGRVDGPAELPSLIHLADFLCRREKIGDGGGDTLPSLDPAALRAFGIHEEPVAALKRIFGYGDGLNTEMEKAGAFSNIARGGDDDGPTEDEDTPSLTTAASGP